MWAINKHSLAQKLLHDNNGIDVVENISLANTYTHARAQEMKSLYMSISCQNISKMKKIKHFTTLDDDCPNGIQLFSITIFYSQNIKKKFKSYL
jgi:hypothetical protein